MLIQVTGGAAALSSLTSNDIPYWVGVLIMGAFVGLIVTLAGAGVSGLIVASIVMFVGSFISKTEPTEIQNEFHDSLSEALYGEKK